MFSEAENNTMQKTPTPTKTLTRHQQETRNFQFNSVLWCQAPPTRPSFKLVFGKHMLGWTSFFLTTNLCMRFLHHGSSIAFVPFFLSFSIFFSLLIVLKLSAHTPGHLHVYVLHVYACMHRHFMSASLKPRSANVLDQSFCNWIKTHFSQKTTIILKLNKNTFVSKPAPLTPSQFFPCLPASVFLHCLRPLLDKTRMDEHPSLRCLQQSCNPLLALNINPECMPGYTLSLVGW